jgi:hypothetical protein
VRCVLLVRVLQFDYLGETTEGNLHLVQRLKRDGMVQVGAAAAAVTRSGRISRWVCKPKVSAAQQRYS